MNHLPSHRRRLEFQGARNGRDIIRWCFADLGLAMLFEKEFEGL
jgi:hypothetical protein